jgi:hypothetical protein
MESRFAKRMGYQEARPVPDVTIVKSYVPADAVTRLDAEVERLRAAESNPTNDVSLQMYSALTENLRQRKPIMIAPVVAEGAIYPIVVVLTFGNQEGTGPAESSFGVMVNDGEVLIDHLFNGDDHQDSPDLRDEYVGRLKEHLKQGHRLTFFPPRLLA